MYAPVYVRRSAVGVHMMNGSFFSTEPPLDGESIDADVANSKELLRHIAATRVVQTPDGGFEIVHGTERWLTVYDLTDLPAGPGAATVHGALCTASRMCSTVEHRGVVIEETLRLANDFGAAYDAERKTLTRAYTRIRALVRELELRAAAAARLHNDLIDILYKLPPGPTATALGALVDTAAALGAAALPEPEPTEESDP